MRKLFVFLGFALIFSCYSIGAQEVESTNSIPEVSLDMRGGYNHNSIDGKGRFIGEALYLDINGQITPHISYSLNHRLASAYYEDNSGFNGTNWLLITYENDDFAINFGKDALYLGSFEYEAYDLDTYLDMNSSFYNSFDCWQWGVSGAWYPSEDHEIIAQIAASPFSYGAPGLFSYAAGWRGTAGCYESYWTANLWQYSSKSFLKAINLGNRFTFGDLLIDADLMCRFGEVEEPYNGFTIILAPSYYITDQWRILTKGIWESTENIIFGAGIEYFPLKDNEDIRFHAVWAHNDFMYGNSFNIGLTWKIDCTGALLNRLGEAE